MRNYVGLTALIILLSSFSASPQATAPQLADTMLSAMRRLGSGETESGFRTLEKLIKHAPRFDPPYRQLIEQYIFYDRSADGLRFFSRLNESDPQNPYPYYALARFEVLNGNFDKAINHLERCVALDSSYQDAYGPFGGIADVFRKSNRPEEAESYFREKTQVSPNDPYLQIGLARALMLKFNYAEALQHLQRAIRIDESAYFSYHLQGYIFQVTGDYSAALKSCAALEKFASERNDLEMVAYAQLRAGGIYFLAGDYLTALRKLNECYKVASEYAIHRRKGMALTNLGAVYATLGEYDRAIDYFERSISILQRTNSRRTLVRNNANIGLALKDSGDPEKAEMYFARALELANKWNYPGERASVLSSIGENYLASGNQLRATAYFDSATTVATQISDHSLLGYISAKLGGISISAHDYGTARKYFADGLTTAKQTNDMQVMWESHAGLGQCYEALKKPAEAIVHYRHAVTIFDSIRSELDIPSLASGFLNDRYTVYPALIRLLAMQGDLAEAFAIAERYKARRQLQILSTGRFMLPELLPDSLRIPLLEMRHRVDELHQIISQAVAEGLPASQIAEVDQQLTALQLEKTQMIDSLRVSNSAFYNLTISEPVTLEELQQTALNSGEIVIEFIVGPNSTLCLAAGKDSATYVEIDISRDSLIAGISKISRIFSGLTSGEDDQPAGAFTADQADFSIPPAHELYLNLLGPIEHVIKDYKTIYIIADDILHYLPFEVLISDTNGVRTRYDFSNAKFLVDDHIISYAPSASLLTARLSRKSAPRKSILAIGNPAFASLDPHRSGGIVRTASNQDRTNKVEFVPLPHAEQEVREIGKLFSGTGSQVYTGTAATEWRFKAEASQYSILHLASHFMLNDRNPMYSRLVLSQKNDGNTEDGFLQTYEIYSMSLSADLVVLSACNSALGKLNSGEGLLGMTGGFLYAGAPSMVVSLWSVDDEATSQIMSRFYHNLVSGLSKNTALQQAKIAYLRESPPGKRDPYYWAPFILIGDAKPLPLLPKTTDALTWYGLIMMAGLVVILMAIRRKQKPKQLVDSSVS